MNDFSPMECALCNLYKPFGLMPSKIDVILQHGDRSFHRLRTIARRRKSHP